MTERKMVDASPQCMDEESGRYTGVQDERLPKVVVHVVVTPGATFSWRVNAATELSVNGARIWLTRSQSPYDYWLTPGNSLRLKRGERLWVSTDGDAPAHLALSSRLPVRRGVVSRWLARVAWLGFDRMAARTP